MRFLVDGYNLMHAMGLVRKGGSRHSWHHSRDQMLDWLADQHGSRSLDATVVFDAQNARGAVYEEGHRGLRVVIARGQTADAVIKQRVSQDHAPDDLSVVSNDHEVCHAAERAGCRVLSCQEYMDELLRKKTFTPSKTREPEKVEEATESELAEWLKAFGG